ncbi:MAG: hypothetical protein UT55_C0048G0015 [Candidatus Peregrinibacteria bacterium GW2011_GWE2_39_6]|nr:MAG: hypothetical protein UT36_C0004G0104 [Candidatus Peregrinibacteria bacterium GW2011_GWF2_39_17]KKR25184.1 MAG: hypothetical protein UT55_C0048G0015 [Candidatus Peregrinibacteria bacterium GW2011_GWE2_39_6]
MSGDISDGGSGEGFMSEEEFLFEEEGGGTSWS